MTSVDDAIWDALICDPAAAAALTAEPQLRRRRKGRLALALPVCLVAVLGGLILRAGDNHAAYALAVKSDGTILLTLREIEGIDGANGELARMGIPVRVAQLSPTCPDTGEPDLPASSALPRIVEPAIGSNGISWRIDTSAIPGGDTVLLEAQTLDRARSVAGFRAMLYRGKAPTCL